MYYLADFSNLKKEINTALDNYKLQLGVLEALVLRTKKDGGAYKDLKKNIDIEATIAKVKDSHRISDLGLTEDDNYFKIQIYTCDTGYNAVTSVWIRRRFTLEYNYSKKEYSIPSGVSPNRVINPGHLIPYYYLEGVEELKQQIELEKEKTSRFLVRAARRDVLIESIEKTTNDFIKKLEELDPEGIFSLTEIKNTL